MDVSLIIPVYKAEDFIEKNLALLASHLEAAPDKWELILVVDASPDRSLALCEQFAGIPRSFPTRVIHNPVNLGKGGTVKRGMLAATGQHHIFTDCDMAYTFESILAILDTLKKGQDVAVANRVHEKSSYTISPNDFHYLYTRHLSSRVFNWIIRHFLIAGCYDTQAGLKGFSQRASQFLFSNLHLEGFSFDVELLYMASHANLHIEEVPIHYLYQHEPSTMAFVMDSLRMIRDIISVRRRSARGVYPASMA